MFCPITISTYLAAFQLQCPGLPGDHRVLVVGITRTLQELVFVEMMSALVHDTKQI
jgi:hypothetical protein